ncbi:hypothetical protein F4819DRAFT_347270 [Hypoxylon fuscum]|nr:hypothetical protein F4819DRAFT_347270 [Hypoxylon fuscum]
MLRGPLSSNSLWPNLRDRLEILDGLGSLGSIFDKSWFTRVWIIQELAVSPDAVVMCGGYQINWENLRKPTICLLWHSIWKII